MKRLIAVLFVVMVFLSACGETRQSEYISSDTLSDAIYDIDEAVTQIAVCNNLAFLLGSEKITRLDLISGERSVIEIEGIALGCDASRLFAITDNKLLVCSHDGTELDSVSIGFEIKSGKICAEGDTVLISADNDTWYGLQSRLYRVNLKKKTCAPMDNSWTDSDYFRVRSLSCREGVADIVYAYSLDAVSGSSQFRAASFDLKDNKVISQFDLPDNTSACIGRDGNAYYSSSFIKNGTKNSVVMYTPDRLSSIVRYIPESICGDAYITSEIFVTECGYVLWSDLNSSIITLSLPDSNEAVTVLAPETLTYDLETISSLFEAEYGTAVTVSRYPDEIYSDKLKTKLLAGDDDFDIFIVDSSDRLLLDSILRNHAYSSVDELYDAFDPLYSGARGLMTDSDGSLFGVPIGFNGYNIMEKSADVILPERFTHSQLAEVCDSLPEGYVLFSDPYPLIRLVTDHIQEGHINEGNVSEQGLAELYAELKRLNDSGRLFAADFSGKKNSGSALKYSYGYFAGVLANPDLSFSEGKLMTLPTVSGTSYISLDSCIMINLNSRKKDSAVNYLGFTLSEDIIYNNSLNPFMLMGRELVRNSNYSGFSPSQIEYLENISAYLSDIRPYTILTDELDSLLRDEILPGLFSGNITSEEAAEKTVSFINYTVYE